MNIDCSASLPKIGAASHQIRRGGPLVSHQAIVNLIAGTTTQTGLRVKAALDTNHYETKVKVTDEELARLKLKRHEFHAEWNYIFVSKPQTELVKVIFARSLRNTSLLLVRQ